MNRVFLLLGTNLGEREKNIERALHELSSRGVLITKKSSLLKTSPWGYKEQPDFLNLAVEAFTCLTPHQLLRLIKEIERDLGRKETFRYGPRVIDIDILFYENEIIKTDELVIPHPLIHKREFALRPLCEIAPDFVHPEFGVSVKELLQYLKWQG